MNFKQLLKEWLPHLGVVALFSVITIIFFYPEFKGQTLAQHDVVQARAMQGEIRDYYEEENDPPLWTNAMFSGMPTYQIWIQFPNNLITRVSDVLKGIYLFHGHIFFLLFLGFYIMAYSLTRNIWASLATALAIGFATFFVVSLDAGHTNKTRSIALIAPILGSMFLAYRGKILLGGILFAFFLAYQIHTNHFQITYYTALAGGIMFIYFLIEAAIKSKWLPFFKGSGLLLLGTLLALGASLSQLWTTYEYSKETIRGGSSELSARKAETKSGGLDYDYVFSWSYGVGETFTVLIPNFYGGASNENVGVDSRLYEGLVNRGVPPANAQRAAENAPTYWGDQPFTAGPTYFGAIICFLALLGLLVIRSKVKWMFLAIGIFFMILAWGDNFALFNDLMYNYFPMYNKFRTPAMALSVTNIAFAALGAMALCVFFEQKEPRKALQRKLYIAAGVTGGIVILVGIIGPVFYGFDAASDAQLQQNGWPVEALKQTRAQMLRADAFRSLIFIVLSGGVLWLLSNNKFDKRLLGAGIAVLILADMWPVASRYLNADDFVSQQRYENEYAKDAADKAILQDDGIYRVFDISEGDPFRNAKPSRHHLSIGGYHAAKLQRYQDLVENRISGEQAQLSNCINQTIQSCQQEHGQNAGKLQSCIQTNLNGCMNQLPHPVLDMLNMKYLVFNGQVPPLTNTKAMGNAWFVQNVQQVENADAEMQALANFNPATTAVVDKRYSNYVQGVSGAAGNASIELTSYHPDTLRYSANTNGERLAVFSEVYYPKGWNAYIDGEKADYIRVNYLLKALKVPAGEHKVTFIFEPRSYYIGEKVALLSSILIYLFVLGGIGLEVKKRLTAKKEEQSATEEPEETPEANKKVKKKGSKQRGKR